MKTVRIQRKPGIWDVKTYKERTIPLSDDAIVLLKEIEAYKKRMRHKGWWIFSNHDRPLKKINDPPPAGAGGFLGHNVNCS